MEGKWEGLGSGIEGVREGGNEMRCVKKGEIEGKREKGRMAEKTRESRLECWSCFYYVNIANFCFGHNHVRPHVRC